jgi:hypothetical protein
MIVECLRPLEQERFDTRHALRRRSLGMSPCLPSRFALEPCSRRETTQRERCADFLRGQGQCRQFDPSAPLSFSRTRPREHCPAQHSPRHRKRHTGSLHTRHRARSEAHRNQDIHR